MSEFRGGSAPFGAAHRGCSGTTEGAKAMDRATLGEAIDAFKNGVYSAFTKDILMAALRAHLATLPRTKTVTRWRVLWAEEFTDGWQCRQTSCGDQAEAQVFAQRKTELGCRCIVVESYEQKVPA